MSRVGRLRWVVTGVLLTALMAPSSALAQEIEGTSEADDLDGTPEADTIAAYGGDDDVRGWDGNDLVLAGTGADTVFGGKGRDELMGGDGPDRLVGGINRDLLRGGEGPDQLSGRGSGVLAGNAGDDVLEIDYPAGARTKVRCGAGDDILYVNGDDEGMSVQGCETVSHVEPE